LESISEIRRFGLFIPGEKSFDTHSKRDRKDLGEGLDVLEKGKQIIYSFASVGMTVCTYKA